MIRTPRLVAAALVLALLLIAPSACRAVDLSGCWSGTWASCQTRHRGPLTAEFVRLNESQYEVFFRGRFFKLLPFQYSVVMDAVEQNGVVQLSGSLYLGRMFGTFTFAAAATDCHFNANYDSCEDNGTFTLSRCSRAEPCYEK
jgi:hypothetical protein